MGTHEVPRNVKGEGRILYIFSTKALIYTAIAAAIGLIFYGIFNMIGLKVVATVILVLFALIGFVIGTFKIPEIESIKFTKKTGGERIDDVLMRAIKFKMKKNRIYTYTKEENK